MTEKKIKIFVNFSMKTFKIFSNGCSWVPQNASILIFKSGNYNLANQNNLQLEIILNCNISYEIILHKHFANQKINTIKTISYYIK